MIFLFLRDWSTCKTASATGILCCLLRPLKAGAALFVLAKTYPAMSSSAPRHAAKTPYHALRVLHPLAGHKVQLVVGFLRIRGPAFVAAHDADGSRNPAREDVVHAANAYRVALLLQRRKEEIPLDAQVIRDG